MATIRLGIHKDYVPNWGVWEGVRDLAQNALDAEVRSMLWPEGATIYR